MTPAAATTVQAAGAVLWRPRPGAGAASAGVEVCLVHRPKYDDWSLPKGKTDPGEHLLACAVREVLEETGHRISLGRPLATQRYPVSGVPKEVHYWAARADDDAPRWQGTREIDKVEFLPPAAAVGRLTQPRDADLVLDVAQDPAPTTPLIVLRHGKAVSRNAWDGTDGDRPLDRAGMGQAYHLAVLLGCFGITRVVSSDALRCVDTVRPYATATRTTVEVEPAISEDGQRQQPGESGRAVRDLLDAGLPTVVCSHRPVLPALLAAATEHAQCEIPTDPLPAGGFLVLHHRGGVAVAAERHDP